MIKKGTIAVTTVKKGKEYAVMLTSKKGKRYKKNAPGYEFPDSLNGKECEVEIVDDKIVKIIVEGKELPRLTGPGIKKKPVNTRYHTGGDKKIPDSIHYNNTHLPTDTTKLHFTKIDNFSLKLNKYARFETGGKSGKFEFYKTNKGREQFRIQPYFGDFHFHEFNHQYQENIKKLEQINIIIRSVSYKPAWRLVVGLGNESVYETSMTLHQIYGFPYIPGSAIKGAVRSMVICTYFDKIEGSRTTGACNDPGFCRIFGSPAESCTGEHIGSVIFFDAYPAEKPQIVPDIINPHYSPYYADESHRTPPADYHDPVPVFFLTIKNTQFGFTIGMKKKDNHPIEKGKFKDKEPLQLVLDWLKETLTEHGIGAKTAVGYGYMNEVK